MTSSLVNNDNSSKPMVGDRAASRDYRLDRHRLQGRDLLDDSTDSGVGLLTLHKPINRLHCLIVRQFVIRSGASLALARPFLGWNIGFLAAASSDPTHLANLRYLPN
ncbi:hypothetical protein R1flu_008742 [Riccia fluitans]|uniref:Uncharacterized protein n=1 Tax=Riccia fluitans TaxID=41844 RepID=A0ABD1YG55_9MARC